MDHFNQAGRTSMYSLKSEAIGSLLSSKATF